MYCASSTKASQYTSRWSIVNKHTALHALKEARKGAHSLTACLQMMAIFLGLGADEILSISSSVLWLLVILLALLPGPQLLTTCMYAQTSSEFNSSAFISSILPGGPSKKFCWHLGQEETRSELFWGETGLKIRQTCFVTTTVNSSLNSSVGT